MALEDDLIQIAGLLCVEPAQSEVVDDQNVGSQKTSEHLLGGMIGPGLVEALQEMIGTQESHFPTGATGSVAESASEKCLPDADGTEKDHVLVTFDEAEREEVAHPVAVEGDRGVPVEALQGVLLVEAGFGKPDAEILVIAPIDLVLQNELEQVELSDLLFSSVGDAVR